MTMEQLHFPGQYEQTTYQMLPDSEFSTCFIEERQRWLSWVRHWLQTGRSSVRFPMLPLEFLISILSHYGPGVDSASNRKFPGVKADGA